MLQNYFNDRENYPALWIAFKMALKEAIQETDKTEFEKAWTSRFERTCLYFDSLLPSVARKLGLGLDKELVFRVDATFYKKGGQTTKVPVIFLESENEVRTSDHEIFKLCSLNAPLKVLMICNDWNEASKKIISEGYWDYIIEDFHDESILTGYFAVIIAEWNEDLKFYTYVYDKSGKVIEDSHLI
ncbi:MAG: hypothetical protein EOP48_20240 [Sphingobacteriales bacterium]|nr:MAG: hypothetical protein EOP48_20240 [Sphingobacteriales bacterium]